MDLKKHELTQKIEKNQSFYKQMLKADENYKTLKVHAHYENLSSVNENLVSKLITDKDKLMPIDIYFIYGVYIDESKVSMDLITQYFVTVMPKPKRQYFLVYFNDHDVSNNFSNFKNVLSLMPMEYFLYLEAIFLVRPSLRMKATRYFTFGTISKYINNKTINIDTVQQLSERIGVKRADILKFLPPHVRGYFVQEQIKRIHNQLEVPSSLLSSNSSGPVIYRNQKGNSPSTSPKSGQQQGKQISMMTMTQKPNSSIISGATSQIRHSVQQGPPHVKKYEITEFDKSQRGIPEMFEVFIHYFREHGNELEEQGIFRKSVSIDDENLAIEKMYKKQYDYLQKVKDPHLVANLIKRFLSKLKTPIISYKIFENLMQTQPLPVEYVSEKMRELSVENMTKFMTLATLLDFLIRKVIPRSHRNKMPAQNVAICFAPCVMWAEQRSIKDLAYINKSVALFVLMLNNFEEVFGSKKELNKVFRTSFYEQQKKNILQTYNLEEIQHQTHTQSLEQQRKTPNFGLLILEKTQHELKQIQDHSDDSALQQYPSGIKNQPQINILSPNKPSSKSTVSKSELKKDQQQLLGDRKSDRSLNKESPNKIIIQIPPPSVGTYGMSSLMKNTVNNVDSPKSQTKLNIEGRVSSNKSDEEMHSLHSDH